MGTRRESVVLELDDQASSGMVRFAASVALARAELDRLNGNGGVGRISVDINRANQSVAAFDRTVNNHASSINQLTGRIGLWADAIFSLGPGLIPIAATGAAALGGLTAAATAAAVAGGSLLVAFVGVTDAIEAMNDYALEPTAENFVALQEKMRGLAPETRAFVEAFQEFRPVLGDIRDAAAAGWFPGLTESLDDFERLAPVIEQIFGQAGAAGGAIVADTADSLDSKRWRPFLRFVADEVPSAMRSLSSMIGDLTHGLAMMWRAFDPSNDSVLAWLEDVAKGFDRWASSSEGRDDIAAFLEYARANGPAVQALFLSLVDALSALVRAAAPLGGPVLDSLTAILNAFTNLAESDLATPILAAVAALAVLRRGMQLTTAVGARMGMAGAASAGLAAARGPAPVPVPFVGANTTASAAATRQQTIMAGAGSIARTTALMGALALATSDVADSTGAANTMSLALMGTFLAPGWGTALGAIAGATIDAAAANDQLTDSIEATQLALERGDLKSGRSNLLQTREELAKLKETVNDGLGFEGLKDPGALFANTKNAIEGIFGDSDVEEGERATAALDEYYAALRRIANLDTVDPTDALNTLFNGPLAGEIVVLTSLVNDFVGALARADGFLSKRGAIVAYEEALDGVNAALKENGRTLDETRPKGRANIKVLDGIADAGLRLAENLRGAPKQRFLSDLESDVRSAAKTFGMSRRELRNYLNELGLIDRKKVKPKADLDDVQLDRKTKKAQRELQRLADTEANPFADLYTNPFDQAIGGVKAKLAALDGDSATTYVRTVFTSSGNLPGALQRGAQAADGGTVPKTGRPYADRHHYLLADGEEVISNRRGQADRNRALLKAINAGMQFQRAADGATAGSRQPMSFDAGRAQQVRPSGRGGGSSMRVDLGNVQLTGTLQTPWGPAQVEGIARAAARQEIDADRQFESAHG